MDVVLFMVMIVIDTFKVFVKSFIHEPTCLEQM